jgi:proline racemase
MTQCMQILPKIRTKNSPCGTKMAMLHHRGEIKTGQEFVNQEVLDTQFQSRIVKTTKIGEIDAMVSEVRGMAYITGITNYLVECGDPRGYFDLSSLITR